MQIIPVTQGSSEWLAVRAKHFTASEAPIALGVSKYTNRTELLHQKSIGVAKEVDAFTQNLFDQGHAAEALARGFAEEIIGGDLFPITATIAVDGVELLASLDGSTMDEETIWEHKLFNAELAEAVRSNNLDPHYTVQMDQQLLVSGAKKCLFMTSDGTPENMAWCWYESSQEKFDALIAGWKQFARDLAAYAPQVFDEKPVGHTPETLPALHIELSGVVKHSNLRDFKAHALAVFAGINRELTTDQHFADAEKTVKWCEDVESRLRAAKEHALSQTQSIDELFKTIDDISAEARRVRLDLDKLVTKRKTEVKDSIIADGRKKFVDHCAALVADLGLGDVRLEVATPDFVGAAKNKRTMASLHDAIDTALSNGKIVADAAARDLRAKLDWYKPHGEAHGFLFRDLQTLIQKPAEDFQLAVTTRIEQHKQAEAEKVAQAAVQAAQASSKAVEQPREINIPQIARPATRVAPTSAPTLRLGQINERLAPIALTAEGLASLGFTHAATDKAAKLFHEADFEPICAALMRHLEAALRQQAA